MKKIKICLVAFLLFVFSFTVFNFLFIFFISNLSMKAQGTLIPIFSIIALIISFFIAKFYCKKSISNNSILPILFPGQKKKIEELATKFYNNKINEEQLKNEIENNNLNKPKYKNTLLNYIVEKALDDGLLDEQEEKQIGNLCSYLNINIPQNIMDKLTKSKILFNVVNGKIPDIPIEGIVPVMLSKNEKIIYSFNHTPFYREVKKTRYVGGAQGFSIRIAKGVYYRVGAFKGNRITENSIEQIDAGSLIITNKNLFFVGQNNSMKIPISQIISVTPFEDGIKISKNGNAKDLIFKTGDGWFSYNLLMNLNNLQ